MFDRGADSLFIYTSVCLSIVSTIETALLPKRFEKHFVWLNKVAWSACNLIARIKSISLKNVVFAEGFVLHSSAFLLWMDAQGRPKR